MKVMPLKFFAVLVLLVLSGCANYDRKSEELKIGSTISKNIFIDSSQFSNPKIKIRFRNSSGDDRVDISAMQADIERSLIASGYVVDVSNPGVILDVNLFFFNTVERARNTDSNGVATILGGVIGYELAKGRGGISGGSGAIIGAVAGSTLPDVLKLGGETQTYLGICDVNIGVLKSKSPKLNSFSIGGNQIENSKIRFDETFESFDRSETIKISVYASSGRNQNVNIFEAMQRRLSKIIANIL